MTSSSPPRRFSTPAPLRHRQPVVQDRRRGGELRRATRGAAPASTSGGASGTAKRASSSTPARSAADRVKLTTTRSHASHPEPRLDVRDGAERGEHLACGRRRPLRPRRRELRSRRRQARSECCRTSIEARWKPNVSACHRRCWSSPQASRAAPPASSDRCRTSRSSRKAAGPSYPPFAPVLVAASRCADSPSLRRCGASESVRPSSRATAGRASASRSNARRSARLGGTSFSETESVRAIRLEAASSPRSTWSDWIAIAARVTSAVTRGLPSRSPPTHVSHRRNGSNDGGRAPQPSGSSLLSISRYTAGSVVKIV